MTTPARGRARRHDEPAAGIPPRARAVWPAWLRALRPHQWTKNALVVLPALAGHLAWTPPLMLRLVVGLAAFSAVASALYLVNDVLDAPHDRAHPLKRHRPVASGALSARAALTLAATLALGGITLAAAGAPRVFLAVLLAYGVLSAGYSLYLKRVLLVDVMTLAALYTIRLVGGAEVADVRLSRWFLAFSVFLFASLGLAKRTTEVFAASRDGPPERDVPGRAYRPADAMPLLALGVSTGVAATLVYCLYITSSDAAALYARPDVLWAGLPLLLYWMARVWLFVARGAMHDDPIVFALRDRVSYLAVLAFLVTVWAAI